jgi:nicotinamidase-related amidase
VVNPLLNLLNNTLARGSGGAELDKRLTVDSGIVVTKRKSDSFNNTELDQVLREHSVGRLVLVGLDAGHCVLSTVQAAQNRDYRVSVIREAVIARTDAEKTEALNRFRSMGVEVAGMDSYLQYPPAHRVTLPSGNRQGWPWPPCRTGS